VTTTNEYDLSNLGGRNDLPRCSGGGCVSFLCRIDNLDGEVTMRMIKQ
jgi:hypothetical protein